MPIREQNNLSLTLSGSDHTLPPASKLKPGKFLYKRIGVLSSATYLTKTDNWCKYVAMIRVGHSFDQLTVSNILLIEL